MAENLCTVKINILLNYLGSVLCQGGIGPAGHSTDDLYVLDLTNDKFKWHR